MRIWIWSRNHHPLRKMKKTGFFNVIVTYFEPFMHSVFHPESVTLGQLDHTTCDLNLLIDKIISESTRTQLHRYRIKVFCTSKSFHRMLAVLKKYWILSLTYWWSLQLVSKKFDATILYPDTYEPLLGYFSFTQVDVFRIILWIIVNYSKNGSAKHDEFQEMRYRVTQKSNGES